MNGGQRLQEDPLLNWAIEYRKNGKYPAGLPRNLKRSVRRRASSIVVDNAGKVYDRRQNRLVELVSLPEEKVRLFNQYHSSDHGHLGWRKTWEAIKLKYYWGGLSKDVKKWVKNCDVCQQRVNRQTCTGLSSSDPGIPQQASDSSWEHAQGQTHRYIPYQVPLQANECCDSGYEEVSGQQLATEEDAGIEDSEFALAMERHAPSTLFMGSAFNVPAVNMQPPYTTGLCGNASDDLITPQTESVQPMDSFSAQVRHAPSTLHLRSESCQSTFTAVNEQLLYMTELCGNESMPMEVSGSPCANDRQYPSGTPMTPLEEHGGSYITEEMIRHVNALSDSEDSCDLVHGRLPMAKVPKLHISDPFTRDDRTRSTLVTQFPLFKLPPQCQTVDEYIQHHPLEGCVESLFRVVRFLEHLHGNSQSGFGAFSRLSSIRLCVSRDLVAFLIPELSKLEEAMKLRLELPFLSEENYTYGIGMVDDIKSLGDMLREFLSLLNKATHRVSRKLLQSLETAAELCRTTLLGVDMAMGKIAQALDVKKRLCTLHVTFPPHSGMCTLDIVCYEGENIYEVLNSALLKDGKTVESYHYRLFYEDFELPVEKNDTIFFLVRKVHFVPHSPPSISQLPTQ